MRERFSSVHSLTRSFIHSLTSRVRLVVRVTLQLAKATAAKRAEIRIIFFILVAFMHGVFMRRFSNSSAKIIRL